MEELFNSYKAFTKRQVVIKDKNIIKALNMIGHYTKHIIVLDIEFYSYMSLNMKYRSNIEILDGKKIRVVPFPKEIAGIWFYKKDKYWIMKGHFHFNTIPPHEISSAMKFGKMKMIHSKYSTVSKDTNNNIMKLEDIIFGDDNYLLRYLNPNELKYEKKRQLARGSHRMFINNSGKYKKLLKKIYKLYITDNLVTKRTISVPSLYKILNTIIGFPNTIITKEDGDIRVMQNYLQLISETNKIKYSRVEKRISHYDIKIFNGIFKEKFGSAKLEDQFNGTLTLSTYKKKVQSFYKRELEHLSNVAHNPLTDSVWALVIALTMTLRCN